MTKSPSHPSFGHSCLKFVLNLTLTSLVLSLAFAPALSTSASACGLGTGDGFFPKNNLRYEDGIENAALTQAEFNAVIDKAAAEYAPVVKARGGILIVDRKWTDPTVNAYAERNGKEYHVAMFGGLARHPMMTTDGFALVLCHEIGHHLGGAPKYADKLPEGVYMANEGEADYFGNLKCMRNVFEKDDNEAVVQALKVPSVVVKACTKSFSNRNDLLLCQRGAMAGLTLAKVLNDVSSKSQRVALKIPSFTTPDKSKVTVTYDAHPEAQCRLDTYYAAAICPKSVNDELSETSAIDGACNTSKGDKFGARPLCWFNPTKYNKGLL